MSLIEYAKIPARPPAQKTPSRRLSRLLLSVAMFVLASCHYLDPEPGIGGAVEWSKLPGWGADDLSQLWPALQAQCPRMTRRDKTWVELCEGIQALPQASHTQVDDFLRSHFRPHRVHGRRGSKKGLITGYYEPILRGSRERNDDYSWPVYGKPDDMLVIELADIYPELKGMRLRGKLDGNRVRPYWPRQAIDGVEKPLRGNEILWLNDPYDSFFAQIQGSARVELNDGSHVSIGYADQNGHPYRAIGKELVAIGELALEDVTLFSIRRWLDANPERAADVLNSNPSYVFFELRTGEDLQPRGSLNVPLTQARSLAVDRRVIPLGAPVWLHTTLPDESRFDRMMMAQDTGGAIRGPVRADVFFGRGKLAEQRAGEMKQSGSLFVLLPIAADGSH